MPDSKTLLQEHLDLTHLLDITALQNQLDRAVDITSHALEKKLPVLVCGNGAQPQTPSISPVN